ncbi:EndoU domain-containing protein [Actinomadura barringtoniae]|uniref:EndoU domain-containing protein n=1 Tax=Actinomadura barringtoniae TaxID=1427535 RepID=A0A939P691_9ACTN|nr:EndoU domain-containing protein [Actinomadura barringtoniae]MBO2446090.1 EndoU domain-containing protein [Actinomadura barringtoniae]
MSEALKFIKKANKRNRAGRMNPHFREHVMGGGHVKPGMPKGSGYHYRPGGEDFPGRRLKPGSVVKDPKTGAYKAEPEFWDDSLNPPGWKPKKGNGGVSTFFPDHWTPQQVDAAIPGAFQHATPIPGTNMWQGKYQGLTIQGFFDGAGGYTHGWPTF